MSLSIILTTIVLAMAANAAPQAEPSEEARDPDLTMSRCSDYCSGTKGSSERSLFVCGDRRLGPVTIPTGLPLSGIAGSDSTYHRFGGLCPGEFIARWTDPSGSYVYPAFDGYQLTAMGEPAMSDFTLPVGTFLDRFGSEYGKYMSPAGTPYAQRSLPPTNLAADPGAEYPYNYHVYLVSRSLSVQGGPIATWFEQQGLGVQFLMPSTVMELVDQGYLSRVNLTADPNWKRK